MRRKRRRRDNVDSRNNVIRTVKKTGWYRKCGVVYLTSEW